MDNTGAVRARYDYDPYGRRTKASGDVDADFGFTGHFTHQETGLDLPHYRAYDPSLGRWLSRDPIGLAGGMNLYAYVYNTPTNLADPDGLFAPLVVLAGMAAFFLLSNADFANAPGPEDPTYESDQFGPAMGLNLILGPLLAPVAKWGTGLVGRMCRRVIPRRAPPVAPPAVTEESIRRAMEGAPLQTTQPGVSVPAVQRYVDRLLAGEVPPPIKVDGSTIIDGNHRYIAGRLCGIEPPQVPWPGPMPPRPTIPWKDVFLDPFDWGNR